MKWAILQWTPFQRELAPHCLKIRCFNQITDGRIRSRVTLGGVSNSICTLSPKVPLCLSRQVSELTFCRIQTSDLVGGEGPNITVWVQAGNGATQSQIARPHKKKWTLIHALTCTNHDKCLVWVWDSADVCQWSQHFYLFISWAFCW